MSGSTVKRQVGDGSGAAGGSRLGAVGDLVPAGADGLLAGCGVRGGRIDKAKGKSSRGKGP